MFPFPSTHLSKSYPSLDTSGKSPIGCPYVTSLVIGLLPFPGFIVILYFSNSPFTSISLNFKFISYFSCASATNGNITIPSNNNTLPTFTPLYLFFFSINIIPVTDIINNTK